MLRRGTFLLVQKSIQKTRQRSGGFDSPSPLETSSRKRHKRGLRAPLGSPWERKSKRFMFYFLLLQERNLFYSVGLLFLRLQEK